MPPPSLYARSQSPFASVVSAGLLPTSPADARVVGAGSRYWVCPEEPQQRASALSMAAQVTPSPALMPSTVLPVQLDATMLPGPERSTVLGEVLLSPVNDGSPSILSYAPPLSPQQFTSLEIMRAQECLLPREMSDTAAESDQSNTLGSLMASSPPYPRLITLRSSMSTSLPYPYILNLIEAIPEPVYESGTVIEILFQSDQVEYRVVEFESTCEIRMLLA